MIDTVSIVFSCALVIYIAYRAVKLDRLIPWFDLPNDEPAKNTSEEESY